MKRGWHIVKMLNTYVNKLTKDQEHERELAHEHKQRYINEVDAIDYSLANWVNVRQLSDDKKYLINFANTLAGKLSTVNPHNKWLIDDNLYTWLQKYQHLTDEEFIQGILHHKSRKEALR